MDKGERKKSSAQFIFTALIAYVFAVGFPLFAKFIFKSHLSIILIILLVSIKPSLEIASMVNRKVISIICTLLSSLYSLVFATVFTIGILITPAELYKLLFEAMQTNTLNPGRLSNLFVLFIAFFSTIFSCTFIRKKFIESLLGMALVISFLSALIYQNNTIVYGVFIAVILLSLIYIARRYLDKGYRTGNIILSVILITLCFGVGLAIRNFVNISRSDMIDDLSIYLRSTVSTLLPQVPLLYELPEFGFSFEDEFKNDLGSTPILSSVPFFEIEGNPGERFIYLRTKIHDQFMNNTWETPSYTDYLVDKARTPIDEKIEEKEFQMPVPFTSVTKRQGGKDPDEIRITLLGEYYNMLPNTLDTTGFRFKRLLPKVEYGDFDKGFYLDKNNVLVSGDIIYIKLGKKRVEKPDSFKPYLQLPIPLSADFKKLYKTYESIKTPRELIKTIREDLTRDYTYNIDTGEIEEGENLLDKFLFQTKEGYSVHFATALIILARANNIPARYATGFFVTIPQPQEGRYDFEGYITTISGLSSHVWPEVWYDDTGWTIEEATPAVNPDFYKMTESGLVYNQNMKLNPMTSQQISAIMGEQVVKEKKKAEKFNLDISIDPLYFLYILVFIIIILLVIRYTYLFRYLLKKNIDTIQMLLKKIIKKHRKKGMATPQEIGWLEWGNKLKGFAPKKAERIENFIWIIIRIVYGGFTVRKKDVKAVFALYRKVRIRKIKTGSSAQTA